jgi:YD repeat-containing protein
MYNDQNLLTGQTDYTYDGRGNLLKQISIDGSGNSTGQYTYTYDGNGNLLKKITIDVVGNLREERYTNNALGRPEKIDIYNQNKYTNTVYYYYE